MRLHRYAPTALGSLVAVALLLGCGEAKSGRDPATSGQDPAAPSHSAGAAAPSHSAGAGTGARAHAGVRASTSASSAPAAKDPGVAAAVAGPAPAAGAQGTVKEIADPEEAKSFPVHGPVHHVAAASPAVAGEVAAAPGAASDAEVAQELAQMHATAHGAATPPGANPNTGNIPPNDKQLLTPVSGGESVGGNGTIPIPSDVPPVIQKVIAGANEIADYPYVYGGGHGSFVDNAYDCSGSVSYALAAGGLLSAPETSGQLESWGVPGPGRYITVYANAGHTYMYVDGILFDTAGRSGPYTSRWQVAPTDNEGYVVRHYPGL